MVPPFGKIVEAFRQTWYEILGPAQPVEVEEPHAIHRVIKTRAHGKEILVDDYIEDPNVSDFFVLLKRTEDNQWVCFFREQFVIAVPVMRKFGKFAMPLVKKRYPQL